MSESDRAIAVEIAMRVLADLDKAVDRAVDLRVNAEGKVRELQEEERIAVQRRDAYATHWGLR
jgi:hypothetical protein